ncbi:hypothetical protein BKA69DRAFT_454114 [Paraphysoderma sedebokerense]|nr:hypothetical protein BKA69DRAFT_454114 [Paraphysoderma sedebokerense]
MYDEDYNEAETENHDASYGQDAKKRTKKKKKNNINIDVWDDSALIAAWDEAVEEYRRHHSLSAENKQESTEAPSVPSKRKLEIEQVETGISTNSTTSSQSPFKQPKIQHPPSSKPCNRPLSVKTTFAMSTSTTKTSTERADPFFPPGSPFTPTTQVTPQYPRTNNFKSPLQPAAPPTTPATPIVKSGTFSINENIKSTSKSKETVVPTKEAIEPAVHTSSTAASNVRPNLESASNLASMVQSQMPEQDEILNNLCMSWYWCGYYTALYSVR